MAAKKEVQLTWRKPLQVPPRPNSMRTFYQGIDPVEPVEESVEPTAARKAPRSSPAKPAEIVTVPADSEPAEKESVAEPREPLVPPAKPATTEQTSPKNHAGKEPRRSRELAQILASAPPKKMAAGELTELLGFEIEDLFDVTELLRGKSLEMYRILSQGRDQKGRCKITQPELMKRSGIKNRRTFYKHEQWLIDLRLLEKRHHPGDHKGVVYRIYDLSEVLPVPRELVEQFEKLLAA